MSSKRIAYQLVLTTVAVGLLWQTASPHQVANRFVAGPNRELMWSTTFNSSLECKDVLRDSNACEVVDLYCREPHSIFNYYEAIACSFASVPLLGTFLLLLWLMYLFLSLGVTAESFFCPTLDIMSDLLHLTQNVAGVTLLAFGNGAADIFSSFTAVTSGSFDLAFSLLLGAGLFVCTAVVGIVHAIVPEEFTVTKRPFFRDIIFHLFATAFLAYVLSTERLRLWHSGVMLAYYAIYIMVVIVGRWVHVWFRQHVRRARINLSSSESSIANTPGQHLYSAPSLNPSSGAVTVSTTATTTTTTTPHEHVHWNASAPNPRVWPRAATDFTPRTQGVVVEDAEDDDIDIDEGNNNERNAINDADHSTDSEGSDNDAPVRRGRTQRRGVNISSSGEFDAPAAPRRPSGSFGPRYGSFRNRSSVRSATVHQAYNQLRLSHPEEDAEVVPEDLIYAHRRPVSIMGALQYRDRQSVDGRSDSSYRRIPTDDDENLHLTADEYEIEPRKTLMLRLLFPVITEWAHMSKALRVFSIINAPFEFILALTVPQIMFGIDYQENPYADIVTNINSDEVDDIGHAKEQTWNRDLLAINIALSPLFGLFVLGFYDVSLGGVDLWVIVLIMSACLGLLFFIATDPYTPPKFYKYLAFYGFVVSMLWVYLIASELVGVIQAVGAFVGLSESLLGFSILAWGNSVGDFVSNLTIARAGHGAMAVSACYGGPMMNMLLGIGLSSAYLMFVTGTESIALTPDYHYAILFLSLLLSLLFSLFFIPKNKFTSSKRFGQFLLVFYSISTVVNIVMEFV